MNFCWGWPSSATIEQCNLEAIWGAPPSALPSPSPPPERHKDALQLVTGRKSYPRYISQSFLLILLHQNFPLCLEFILHTEWNITYMYIHAGLANTVPMEHKLWPGYQFMHFILLSAMGFCSCNKTSIIVLVHLQTRCQITTIEMDNVWEPCPPNYTMQLKAVRHDIRKACLLFNELIS